MREQDSSMLLFVFDPKVYGNEKSHIFLDKKFCTGDIKFCGR